MNIDKKRIHELLKIPLTNFSLHKFAIFEDDILKYSELQIIKDLSDEILTKNNSYKILLFEYKKNSGHWVCILRYDNVIEFYNSYGIKHSKEDFMDDKQLNEYLGQYRLFLDELLKREIIQEEFEVIYNKVRHQKKHREINTCGRHVVLRILCMKYFNMNLLQYQNFIENSSKKLGLNYDEFVTYIIS